MIIETFVKIVGLSLMAAWFFYSMWLFFSVITDGAF